MTEQQPTQNAVQNPAQNPAHSTGQRTRDQGPVIIKKYANRRLYNTDSSTYVTLETLAEMVQAQLDFMVVDAKTGEDLTRPTLTQIIVEQETKAAAQDSASGTAGMNLLPVPFLRQLIGMYGGSMQFLVPNYLEQTMRHFTENQQQWQQQWQAMLDKNASQMQGFLPKPVADQLGAQMQAPLQAFQQMGQQAAQRMQQSAQQMQQQMQQQAQTMQQAMLKFFMPFATGAETTARDKADALEAMKRKVASLEAELKGMDGD